MKTAACLLFLSATLAACSDQPKPNTATVYGAPGVNPPVTATVNNPNGTQTTTQNTFYTAPVTMPTH